MSLLLALVLAGSGPREMIDPVKVRDIAQDFAICAVKKHPELASKYVLDAGVWLEKRDFRKLFNPGCVPTDGWRFTAISGGRTQMRFALAEALIRLHYPSASMADVVNAAPLDHEPMPIEALPDKDKPRTVEMLANMEKARAANQAISMLGECIVRASPVAAHGLLLSEPGSESETQYLAALQPVAGNCVEKGAAINLTKFSLRGTIALNFYSLAMAARATPRLEATR